MKVRLKRIGKIGIYIPEKDKFYEWFINNTGKNVVGADEYWKKIFGPFYLIVKFDENGERI